jgi:hypothetical protein
MRMRCCTLGPALVLLLGLPVAVSAQPAESPSLRETLETLALQAVVPGSFTEAISFATALEVANAPFASSAGGFVFKLDPATGLKVRSAPTFGPSFAERALTAGEGRVSFGVSLAVANYDRLNKFNLEKMQVSTIDVPEGQIDGFLSMVLSSETIIMSGTIGATDNLDIGVVVPIVKVKLDGLSWIEDSDGFISGRTIASGESTGLGDVAINAKYRVLKFGEGQPDPGGVALQLTTRLPTGQRENFRGLGITRVLGSVLVSAGRGKIRPHGNVGFEWWEKGLGVDTNIFQPIAAEARHQIQYAAGVEIAAGPKITLLVDVLGRHILGDGTVVREAVPVPPDLAILGIEGLELTQAVEKGIRKLTLAPGLKWNLKGNFVLSTNGLISLQDNGLRDFFTPVVGLDWTF